MCDELQDEKSASSQHLEAVKEKLSHANKSLLDIQMQLMNQQTLCERLEDENNTLKGSSEEMGKMKAKLMHADDENTALQAKLLEQQAQCESVQSKLAESNLECSGLQMKVMEAETAAENGTEGNVDEAQSELVAKVKQKLLEANNENGALDAKLTEMEAVGEQRDKELARLREASRRANDERAQEQTELLEARTQNKKLNKTTKQLQDNLDKLAEEIRTLQNP